MNNGFLDVCVELIKTASQACLSWFSLLMEKTGMVPFYGAGIFIVLTGGFLLSRFGGLVGPGSDLAAGMMERKKVDGRYRMVFTPRRSGPGRQRALPGPKALPSGRSDDAKRISRKG